MEYFNGNLAREAGRLIDHHGAFWADRYHLIPISPEPDALVERLRYVLSNTIKENLVARVSEWEGLHCAQALIDGIPMAGTWYDRAAEYEVHRQAERKASRNRTPVEPVKRGDFMTPYELKLAPLPCWRNLPRAQIRKRIARRSFSTAQCWGLRKTSMRYTCFLTGTLCFRQSTQSRLEASPRKTRICLNTILSRTPPRCCSTAARASRRDQRTSAAYTSWTMAAF